MKYTALLLVIACITVATCNISFLSKDFKAANKFVSSFFAESEDNTAISDFYNGLFGFFNLSSPSQVLDCYCDKTSKLLFASLYEKYELLKDTTQSKTLQLHIDYAKLLLIYKGLESTNACIATTQDFTDLLNALNISERNPQLFSTVAYLYYQAHYDDLYEEYQPLINNLNAKNYTQAGEIYGSIIQNLVETVESEGTAHLAFNGFGNGFATDLDLDEPSDSMDCYDNDTSRVSLYFLYKLSVAVTDGKILEAPVNTLNFWENEGKEILSKIPDSVKECDVKSSDHQKLTNKLGIDVYSEEFGDLTKRYINNNRIAYYGYLKRLRNAFEDHNFIHAGQAQADFISAIAKTQ